VNPRGFFTAVIILLQHACPAAVHYQQLLTFGTATSDSAQPSSPVIQASDGALYGTAYGGGTNGIGYGTLFKLNRDGSGYVILHNFSFSGGDGSSPAGILEGSDGWLYGTTYGYGAYPAASNGVGTVFKLHKDGSAFTLLHAFGTNSLDPRNPWGALIQATDGALYGTTYYGGANPSAGTLFTLNTNGDGYSTLHDFGVDPGDGANCSGVLLEGNDGALYGTTSAGGTNGAGTVFKLNKDGSGYTVLYTFKNDGVDGQAPADGLVQDSDGALYGTTRMGGTNLYSGYGTVFKLNTDGSGYRLLFVFNLSGADGQYPNGRLVEGNDGGLYGVTSGGGTGSCNGGCGTIFRISKDGTTYARLHDLGTIPGDGVHPIAGLIQGSDGALYGTCQNGGGGADNGAIVKLNTDGTGYVVLRRLFGTLAGGYFPQCGLAEGSDGALYGTDTLGGGYHNAFGTVYRLNKDGTGYAVLYGFGGPGNDGQNPYAALVEGADHGLYGTTFFGGASNYGTIFKLQKDGTGYTILHNFGGPAPDGLYPNGTLIQASDGALYGTTEYGGSGTVYKLNPEGSGFGIVHGFPGTNNDGASPYAGVIEASDGALYGSTSAGGSNNAGIVFKVNKNGTGYAILHHFTTNNLDGQSPRAALLEADDGALYGTTANGGSTNRAGTVFKIAKDGTGYARASSLRHQFHRLRSSLRGPSAGDGPRPLRRNFFPPFQAQQRREPL
jgi:uncharacterized repeat protein (TIGR03803 family)